MVIVCSLFFFVVSHLTAYVISEVDADTFNAVLASDDILNGWEQYVRGAPSKIGLDQQTALKQRFQSFVQVATQNCDLSEGHNRALAAILEGPRIPDILTPPNLQRRVFYHLFLANNVNTSLIDYIIEAHTLKGSRKGRRRKHRQRNGNAGGSKDKAVDADEEVHDGDEHLSDQDTSGGGDSGHLNDQRSALEEDDDDDRVFLINEDGDESLSEHGRHDPQQEPGHPRAKVVGEHMKGFVGQKPTFT